MLQFFTAGIFAGGVQSIAVTITILFSSRSGGTYHRKTKAVVDLKRSPMG